jgi:hypothetical protein
VGALTDAALAGAGQGFASPDVYAREFRNQVLDFMAANPPRFGVNWSCTMDVAIRIANWLVAYDLFRSLGARHPDEFEAEFAAAVVDHGRHIAHNLEWHPHLRTNHYLSNVVGLLFVAAYLPSSPIVDGWLCFSVRELVEETALQFTSDGASFEASTTYHRLAAEMVTYGTALVVGLPEEKHAVLARPQLVDVSVPPGKRHVKMPLFPAPDGGRPVPFPGDHFRRLARMGAFTAHVTKPGGHVAQVGDNDSGRFLKLWPTYRQLTVREAKQRYANLNGYAAPREDAPYLDEDHLDHAHLIGAIDGLRGHADGTTAGDEAALERDSVTALARGRRLLGDAPSQGTAAHSVGDAGELERLRAAARGAPEGNVHVCRLDLPGVDLRTGLLRYAYPDFGLFLFRSGELFLSVRCGTVGQGGNGGHAHNDQLAIELSVQGKHLLRDPGTYVYTPLPERRNDYRSVAAHAAPRVHEREEPGQLDQGLFRLSDLARAQCQYFGEHGFVGVHHGYGYPLYRCVEIDDHAVTVTDVVTGPLTLRTEDCALCRIARGDLRPPGPAFSPGYGTLLRPSADPA